MLISSFVQRFGIMLVMQYWSIEVWWWRKQRWKLLIYAKIYWMDKIIMVPNIGDHILPTQTCSI